MGESLHLIAGQSKDALNDMKISLHEYISAVHINFWTVEYSFRRLAFPENLTFLGHWLRFIVNHLSDASLSFINQFNSNLPKHLDVLISTYYSRTCILLLFFLSMTNCFDAVLFYFENTETCNKCNSSIFHHI